MVVSVFVRTFDNVVIDVREKSSFRIVSFSVFLVFVLVNMFRAIIVAVFVRVACRLVCVSSHERIVDECMVGLVVGVCPKQCSDGAGNEKDRILKQEADWAWESTR